MIAILFYDFRRINSSEVREAMRRAEFSFGKGLRYEGFNYEPCANAADEAREGGPLSLSTSAGRFRGIEQIRAVFPLPEEVEARKEKTA